MANALPRATDEPTAKPDRGELIALAYRVVVAPESYADLSHALQERLTDYYAASERQEGGPFADVEGEFRFALDLFERAGAELSSARQMLERLESLGLPAFTLTRRGVVAEANARAKSDLAVTPGQPLPAATFGGQKVQRALASALRGGTRERFAGILSAEQEGGRTAHLSLTPFGPPHEQQLLAQPIALTWNRRSGGAFAETFSLSGAERDIARAIIAGQDLRDVAEERGTSLGTVRNQTKRLMQKLGAKSRLDIVALFVGYSKLHGGGAAEVGSARRRPVERSFRAPSGRNIVYTAYGPKDGEPVLVFHPLFGGNLLAPGTAQLLQDKRLRLIVPWRPHLGGTDGAKGRKGHALAFADDLDALLQDFGIGKISLLGVNGGASYAFAFARHFPGLVRKLVTAGGVIPIFTTRQFFAMSPEQRLPLFLARHAPSVASHYTRATLARTIADYDDTFLERYFKATPTDYRTITDEHLGSLIKSGTKTALENGPEGAVAELLLASANWKVLLPEAPCDVVMLVGEEDRQNAPGLVAEFAREQGYEQRTVPGAGTFLFHQKPDAVLTALTEA
ncbi:alpha/beta fold hydrolase [Parvularcula maris]|uniref:Alpha/beta fold hydrolase n=1 Tax=Parvularcula maris TaxID=2965077 RepID=A0A9X2LAY4_9PROT|nr:alpha/beta fold hydrolase [Parvularcula maris]MCQ8186350.1 alpha/beta fold hydrolase [Parvularcula maris]